MKDTALDQRFCERVIWRRQERVLAASRWTNMMLKTPSDEIMDLTLAMNSNQLLRDEFTNNFNYPERQWDRLASASRIRAWMADRTNKAAVAA